MALIPPPPLPPSPVSVRAAGGFLDRFLAGVLANSLAVVGVGLAVYWMVDRDGEERRRQDAELWQRIELLQAENASLRELNLALAGELHDSDMEAEVLRWQLKYAEERLREAQAAPTRQGRRAMPPAEPAPKATFEALDEPAAAAREAAVKQLAQSGPVQSAGGRGSALDLADFEPEIPAVQDLPSQLDRSRAIAAWKGIIDEAGTSECGRMETGAVYRCRKDVERSLAPFGSMAVDCILTGNAVPDYVVGVDMNDLPSHSVRLDEGAIIMCDEALRNL